MWRAERRKWLKTVKLKGKTRRNGRVTIKMVGDVDTTSSFHDDRRPSEFMDGIVTGLRSLRTGGWRGAFSGGRFPRSQWGKGIERPLGRTTSPSDWTWVRLIRSTVLFFSFFFFCVQTHAGGRRGGLATHIHRVFHSPLYAVTKQQRRKER